MRAVILLLAFCTNAGATAPTIDTFNVQSYLKLSNNTAISATSANFVFAIFKGANCVWAKRYSAVPLNNGVLNQKISGTGSNISSINNSNATPSECVNDFSTTTLNSTLLNTGSPAALGIRIYTETSIDTFKPIWDIPLNSAPTAFIADTATTAATASDLASGIKVSTSAGAADAGKFPVLNASGKIDSSMIDASLFSLANSQVSGLGTASTINTGTTAGTIPLLNGSGQISNSMIDSTSLTPNPANFSTFVPVSKGGTGATTLPLNALLVGAGTGAVTTITPGANGTILSSNGTTFSANLPNTLGIVDITSTQSVSGAKTFSGATEFTNATPTVMDNGIKLKTSGAGSTTLAHYEEGTFTPVYAGTTSGNTSNCTYTQQTGIFTRIGRVVTFSIILAWSSCTSAPTGSALVQGLPYASNATAGLMQIVSVFPSGYNTSTTASALIGKIVPSSTQIELWTLTTAATALSTATVIDSSSNTLMISGSYQL